MSEQDNSIIALQEAYANIYNEIVKPDRVFVATQYFRKKWMPLLGPSLSWVIVALRQHCYWSRKSGEKRDWCLISQEQLAAEAGISVATLKRLLKHEYASNFVIDVTHRYHYNTKKRKQLRKKSMYRLRMDDPLIPEDEARLKEMLLQKLSGLNINPDTGQMDVLLLLDQLAKSSTDDLQLNLNGRSNDPEQDKIEQPVNDLVEKVSKIITGTNGHSQPENCPYHNGKLVKADELKNLHLAEDELLVLWQGDYLVISIVEVVKRDLRVSGGHPSKQTQSECFYSVLDALGEGPQEWLPEEKKRIDQLSQTEHELGEFYRQLGFFSLEEALRQYFNSQLTADILKKAENRTESNRIREWLIYTSQIKGLKNPGGFLRSRLEGDELPPTPSKL